LYILEDFQAGVQSGIDDIVLSSYRDLQSLVYPFAGDEKLKTFM